MITFVQYPLPVTTPIGDAFVIYVTSNNLFENDEFTCAMMEDGQVRHFSTADIKVWHNGTYGINKKLAYAKKSSKKTKKRSGSSYSISSKPNKKSVQKIKKRL